MGKVEIHVSLLALPINVSLKFNSAGFYQMAKIAVTPAIVLAEFIVLGKRILFQKAQLQVLQAEESLPRQLIACLIQLKAKSCRCFYSS
ncbi:hypothetical protein ACET3Z_012883 [Daucus carota]